MSKRKCGLCGKDPAAGFASINGVWYCHGGDDSEPTCYMLSQGVHLRPMFPPQEEWSEGLWPDA